MMEIVLDGKRYPALADQTVLDVARANAIPIPTLCQHDGLAPYGACRLCLVEVVQGGPTGLHSSCSLPVTPGLEALTNTDRVRRARRVTIELLLARSPEPARIKQLASSMGVDTIAFAPRNELCVLCGRCVRACAALGIHAIAFSWRGIDRRVSTPFDEPSEVCVACRACFNVCPTGAIEATVLPGQVEIPTWNVELRRIPCSLCGKPYATERAWNYLQNRLPESLRAEQPVCPECRSRDQLWRLHGEPAAVAANTNETP